MQAVKRFKRRIVQPGLHFNYASAETSVLGLVLASATKRKVSDYAREKLWEPLGAEAGASWGVDAMGQEVTYAFFNAVLRDWARLGLMLAHDGIWNGKRIVPREWLSSIDLDSARIAISSSDGSGPATATKPGSCQAAIACSRCVAYGDSSSSSIRQRDLCSCRRRSAMEATRSGTKSCWPCGRRCHYSCDRLDLRFHESTCPPQWSCARFGDTPGGEILLRGVVFRVSGQKVNRSAHHQCNGASFAVELMAPAYSRSFETLTPFETTRDGSRASGSRRKGAMVKLTRNGLIQGRAWHGAGRPVADV